MNVLRKTVWVALIVWSVLMLLSGLLVWVQTLGTVVGSQFGLQATLVNKVGMFMVWAALYSFWRMLGGGQAEGR